MNKISPTKLRAKFTFEVDGLFYAEFITEVKDLGITQKELFLRTWESYKAGNKTIMEQRKEKGK